jgi:transposase
MFLAWGHLSGTARSQLLRLPEAVDDYVGPDNPVRFIEAFVDELDLGAAGFGRAQPKATGRPGYEPAELLKLHIYGYLNRIRSSRRLEAETHRNVMVIWLLRHLRPTCKTIADFRRDNRAAFKTVSASSWCRVASSLSLGASAWRWTAHALRRSIIRLSLAKFIPDTNEKLAGYMKRLDEGDADEDRAPGGGSGSGLSGGNGKLAEKIAAIQASVIVTRQCLPNCIARAPTRSD